jgi:hypothetical protein
MASYLVKYVRVVLAMFLTATEHLTTSSEHKTASPARGADEEDGLSKGGSPGGARLRSAGKKTLLQQYQTQGNLCMEVVSKCGGKNSVPHHDYNHYHHHHQHHHESRKTCV